MDYYRDQELADYQARPSYCVLCGKEGIPDWHECPPEEPEEVEEEEPGPDHNATGHAKAAGEWEADANQY